MSIIVDGAANTIAGLAAGGLPDATVTPADLTQPLTLGTAQNSTSGTAIDFTGIPSWVKRSTVVLNGVSTSGTNNLLVQIGSGSVETSGYLGAVSLLASGAVVQGGNNTTAFIVVTGLANPSLLHGAVTLTNIGSNIWAVTGVIAFSTTAATVVFAGSKTTAGALDRVRLTTTGGTDTFDAGSVNILYE